MLWGDCWGRVGPYQLLRRAGTVKIGTGLTLYRHTAMLIVLSPAKTLDYDSPLPAHHTTQPRMLTRSQQLIDRAKSLSASELSRLMKVSDRIAQLNERRFAEWTTPFSTRNARAAIFAFKGDVYTGLDSACFSADDLAVAQQRLRILSGLYGVLRPLDLMQPYRLEMGTRLATERGANLYSFWGDTITDQLRADMQAANTDTLINLASNEYFKAVTPSRLGARVIAPVFQDEKHGRYKVVSFWAKKARGRMAAWIVKNNLTHAAQLQPYNLDGYCYVPDVSTETALVFRRSQQ